MASVITQKKSFSERWKTVAKRWKNACEEKKPVRKNWKTACKREEKLRQERLKQVRETPSTGGEATRDAINQFVNFAFILECVGRE